MLALLQCAILAVRQRSPLKGGGNFNCATYCGHTVPGYRSRMLLVMWALQAASLSSLTSRACWLLSKSYVLLTKMDFKKQSITVSKWLHKYTHLLTKGKNLQVTYHDIYLYWTSTAVRLSSYFHHNYTNAAVRGRKHSQVLFFNITEILGRNKTHPSEDNC